MTCSICNKKGHNKRSCKKTTQVSESKIKAPDAKPDAKPDVKAKPDAKADVKEIPPVKVYMALQAEDTGKMFEMAICLAYGISYDGKYKYSMEIPEKLKLRLSKLIDIFPMCRHTAKRVPDMIILL